MYKTICLCLTIISLPKCYGVDLSDGGLTTPQLIAKYGYTPEIHHVTTENGYILEMHRIVSSPQPISTTNHSKSKNVVLAVHGLSTSSADFIYAGPNVSLGFYLSDLGYDVWLGNNRGNIYSRNHTHLSPNDSKFWKFSWHEMGIYDLTATIDYILNVTKHKTLSYIGFSQGTTLFFPMCTERPLYQKKVNLMQAIAPVVYLYRTKNPIIKIVGFLAASELKRAPYKFPPFIDVIEPLLVALCTMPQTKNLCLQSIFQFVGADYKYFNYAKLPIALHHVGKGASNLNVVHYGQLAVEDRFGQLDYGISRNMKKYGQATPPDYNISSVTVPVMLIYSRGDAISLPADVHRLRDTLPNLAEYYEPVYKEYNHWDYAMGKDVRKVIYVRMAEVLKKFSRH